jgi:hypothetical protein
MDVTGPAPEVRRAAVLGHPITHSLSPALHTAAYRALGLDGWEYGRHDVDEHDLETFLRDLDRSWAGLSLTMPLKHRALELVDHVDPLAAAVGAVNTVLVTPTGLTGTNTDVYGLVQALREGLGPAAGIDRAAVNGAVVLGGGATAASALAALAELGQTSPRVLVRSLDRTAELRAAISAFAEVGGGARFGTMVHEVLEHTDFSAPDLPAAIRAALDGRAAAAGVEFDQAAVVAGLEAAITTPLGPLVGDVALSGIGLGARLDELHFELPLAGGDTPVGSVSMSAIHDALVAHLPGDDPLATYATALAHPDLAQSVHGYLSGSIDLVARIDGRYVVADYKSNWLGVDGEELSAWHYRPSAVATAMMRAHYPLQALIYSVALHRFLRSRLGDYRPDTHLGGVLYLFLRGKCGPATPRVGDQPCGVFAWKPPTTLIEALSDLFDRGEP